MELTREQLELDCEQAWQSYVNYVKDHNNCFMIWLSGSLDEGHKATFRVGFIAARLNIKHGEVRI